MKIGVNFTWFQIRLYYFAKFFGLAPFVVRGKKLYPASFLGKAYAVVLMVLCIIWAIDSTRRRKLRNEDTLSTLVFAIFFFLLAASVSSSLLILAFRSETIVDIVNRLNAIDDELKSLNNQKNQEGNWRINAKIIASNITVLVLITIVKLSFESGNLRVPLESLYWMANIMVIIHSHSTIFIFSETMLCIRQHFETLNNELHGIVQQDCEIFSFQNLQSSLIFGGGKRQRIYNRAKRGIMTDSPKSWFFVERIEKMRVIHGELCDLVNLTTDVMTIPMVFTASHHFSKLLVSCYILYPLILEFTSDATADKWSAALSQVPRIVVVALELFLIVDSCSSICKAFLMFSIQLLQNPVAVSVLGFFDLDYSYIYKILCAVVAYLVIMIQFDASRTHRGT